MIQEFLRTSFLRGSTKVYKKASQASEAPQPYFKEGGGIQGSGILTRFAVKEFFSYESFNARKKKKLVPTSYLQEEYKICHRVFFVLQFAQFKESEGFLCDKLHARATFRVP
jgi:hypothetical protein